MPVARNSALALFLICSNIYKQEHTVNIPWFSKETWLRMGFAP
jgi:hypothetical protein